MLYLLLIYFIQISEEKYMYNVFQVEPGGYSVNKPFSLSYFPAF